MPWRQRVVGIVQILKEYSSIPRLLAIVLLPIAFFSIRSEDILAQRLTNMGHGLWLRVLFVAVFLSQKLNTYILYSHVGLGALRNMQSNRIWGAFRKILMPVYTSMSLQR